MGIEINLVKYRCEECNEEFEIKQGSKRRFCDKCLIKRVTEKGKKEGEDGNSDKV